MSHQSTVNLVNKLGSDYDARVIKWRNNMLEEAEEVTTLEYSSTKCDVQYITFQVQLPVQLAGDNYDSSCESVSDKSQSSILAPSFSPISSRSSTDSLTSLEADMQIMDERGALVVQMHLKKHVASLYRGQRRIGWNNTARAK